MMRRPPKAGRKASAWTVHLLLLAAAMLQATDASASDRLFVLSSSTDDLRIIDPSSGGVVGLSLGNGLRASSVTMSADGGSAYVWSASLDSVFVIDTQTRQIVSQMRNVSKERTVIFPRGLPAGDHYVSGVHGIVDDNGDVIITHARYSGLIHTFDPHAQKLYQTWEHKKVLLAIDASTGTIAARLPLEDFPRAHVLAPDRTRLFVLHPDSVTAIDTASYSATKALRINGGISELHISPDARFGFARKTGSDLLTIIDLERWRAVRHLRIDPPYGHLSMSRAFDCLYVSAASEVTVVDLMTLEFALADSRCRNPEVLADVVSLESDVVRSADGTEVYTVAHEYRANQVVSVLRITDAKTGNVLAEFVDDPPTRIETGPDSRVYVTQPASGRVRVIDPFTASVAASVPPLLLPDGTPLSPIDIAFTSEPALAYVAYRGTNAGADYRRGAIAVYRLGDLALENVVSWGDENLDDDPNAPIYWWDIGAPTHIAVKPDGSEAYVMMESLKTAVVDMAALAITDSIDLGSSDNAVSDLAMAPDGRRLYALHWLSPTDDDRQSVAVIDTETREVSKWIVLPGNASYNMGLLPDESAFLVSTTFQDWGSDPVGPVELHIAAIDWTTDSIRSTVKLETTDGAAISSGYLATSQEDQIAYVTQWAAAAILVLDAETGQVLRTVPAGQFPSRLAASSAVGFPSLPTPMPTPTPLPTVVRTELPVVKLPILSLNESSLTYTDADGSREVAVDGMPVRVVADPTSSAAYVVGTAHPEDGGTRTTLVWRIANAQAELVASLPLESFPWRTAISPDGGLLYVAGASYARVFEESSPGFDTDLTVLDLRTGAWRSIALLEGVPCAVVASDTSVHVVTNHALSGLVVSDHPSPDDESIVTTFDSRTHRPASRIIAPGACHGIALHPSGKELAIFGDRDDLSSAHLVIVNLETGEITTELLLPELHPTGALFREAQHDLLISSDGPEIAVLDIDRGGLLRTIALPSHVTTISRMPEGSLAYLWAYDRDLVLFDPTEERPLGVMPIPLGNITVLCRTCEARARPTDRVPIDQLPDEPPELFPTPTAEPTPIAARMWIRAEDVYAEPGDRVEAMVSLYIFEFADGASAELWFPPGVTVAPWRDGDPDCEVLPTTRRAQTTFSHLPPGCTPNVDCSGVSLDVVAESRLSLYWRPIPIFRCRLDVDPSLAPGIYPLRVGNATTSFNEYGGGRHTWPDTLAIDGRIWVAKNQLTATPTSTPTPSEALQAATTTPASEVTPTPTASATEKPSPTMARGLVSLHVESSPAVPGGAFTFSIRLRSQAVGVAGIQNDLEVAAPLAIRRCRVNPEIGKAGIFSLYPGAEGPEEGEAICPPGRRCDRMRAIVVSLENAIPIPSDAVVYTCSGDLPPMAPAGSYPITLSSIVASDERGTKLEAIGLNSSLEVHTSAQGSTSEQDHENSIGPRGQSTGGCDLHPNHYAEDGWHFLLLLLPILSALSVRLWDPAARITRFAVGLVVRRPGRNRSFSSYADIYARRSVRLVLRWLAF